MPHIPSPLLWLVFTAVAVGTGLGAVALVEGSVTAAPSAPLSAGEVADELAALSTAVPSTSSPTPRGGASPSPTRSSSPTPSGSRSSTKPTSTPAVTNPPAAVTRTLVSAGGSVQARCDGAVVTLVSWSPAEGFVVDEVHRGPATEAEIRFESAQAEVRMSVTCEGNQPQARTETRTED